MNEIKFTPIGVMKKGNKQKVKYFKDLAIFARNLFVVGIPIAYVAGLVCGILL